MTLPTAVVRNFSPSEEKLQIVSDCIGTFFSLFWNYLGGDVEHIDSPL